MASEKSLDKSAVTERKPSGAGPTPSQPSPKAVLPLLNDGPEMIRDSHC